MLIKSHRPSMSSKMDVLRACFPAARLCRGWGAGARLIANPNFEDTAPGSRAQSSSDRGGLLRALTCSQLAGDSNGTIVSLVVDGFATLTWHMPI